MKDNFSKEEIENFLLGRHPMEGIVSIEVAYADKFASVIYKDEDGVKRIQKDPFKPFVWLKKKGAQKLFLDDRTGKQNRRTLKSQMDRLGLKMKALKVHDSEGNVSPKLSNGYNLMIYATRAISYAQFMQFFKTAGVDLYDESRDFLVANRVEQHMMTTGKRYFKGFEDYDELIRLSTDLETEGLEPTEHRIKQIGIRTNKGFEIILSLEGETREEKDASELEIINGFLKTISLLKPDVITGYNSENFDWNFLIVRSEMLGYEFKDLSTKILKHPIYKSNRGTVLKLGGEMEYFFKTNLFGYNITDALHAVRRAQAMDSNMKRADLKYITKYSKLSKQNRVYIQGDKINTVLSDETNDYAFNNTDGKWYKITNENPLKDGYEIVKGRYIVERYLLDDIYETDKVELMYNQTNFLISKLLPTSFQRATTMGTAGIWRLIMMAWSIEHNLAIPEFGQSQSFTGGLSRLLEVGYSENVLKLDFNSLYPSIIITWGIESETDVSNVMLMLLEYILTTREESKELKSQFGKKLNETKDLLKNNPDDSELLSKVKQYDLAFKSNDNKQLQQKILANSFFGSFGSPNIFPWGDINCAEQTTCTGRQSLRLMVKWFSERGYKAIVGDSVTYDTPVYIKYPNGNIDIKAISELFSEESAVDFGNEQLRDLSEKPYRILTRNGWKNINYVYRHKTDKPIHRVETKDRMLDVTSDHSLFRGDKTEVQPKNLVRNDDIEVYDLTLTSNDDSLTADKAWLIGLFIGDGSSVYKDKPQKYFPKRKQATHYNMGKRGSWKISNINLDLLEKAKNILENEYGVKAKIKDHLKSSGVYNLKTENSKLSKLFSESCYTNYRFKKVPTNILNSNKNIKKSFLDGLMAADGDGTSLDETRTFGQKSQVVMASVSLLLKELGLNYRLKTRKDKENYITFVLKNHHGNDLNDNFSPRKTNKVHNNNLINNPTEYVYDVSTEDGTFVAGIGCITAHNTDGFNFVMDDLEGIKNRKYIGKGLNRNTVNGREYTGADADVAEFNDLFMRNKMGLDIDEVIVSNIVLARKNYADLFDYESQKMKLVGNTIKSKSMPMYIERFIDKGIKLLLNDKGNEFLKYYYDYIEKIYNFKIPLKEIASKGRVKKSMKEYIAHTKTVTKAGSKKARQAWYELLLRDNVKADIGDTVYYVNTGEKKNDPDVKRVTEYYHVVDGEKVCITKELQKDRRALAANGDKMSMNEYIKEHKYKKTFGNIKVIDEDIITLNSILLDNELVESDKDTFCDDTTEYNSVRYIEQFNKRISPLLVCFSPEIRDEILIDNPNNRKEFVESKTKLTSGFPNKPTDQDTYEELMTMEDKEIKFWLSVDKEPPFLEEIGMDWDSVTEDYKQRMEVAKEEGVANELEKYDKIINSLTAKQVDDFNNEGSVPTQLTSFLDIDVPKMKFKSKKYGVVIGSLYDICDRNIESSNE